MNEKRISTWWAVPHYKNLRSQMSEFCPHCGTNLPRVLDAFRPQCRTDLDTPLDPIRQIDTCEANHRNQGIANDRPTSEQASPAIVHVILLVLAAPIVVGVFFNLFYFTALFLFHLPNGTALRAILWLLAVAATFPLIAKMYREQDALENKYNKPTDGT
jgi:hypothetical protein